jgi:hypothetical protein
MELGDTGFEPVTSSASEQNFCSGMRTSVASGPCAGSLMSATVRVGWPTVWPTVDVAQFRPLLSRRAPWMALFGGHRAGGPAATALCRRRGCRKAHLIIGVAVGDVLGRVKQQWLNPSTRNWLNMKSASGMLTETRKSLRRSRLGTCLFLSTPRRAVLSQSWCVSLHSEGDLGGE